jgi:ABC-type Fe3+-hydroxamate transport system substrate-binding protein
MPRRAAGGTSIALATALLLAVCGAPPEHLDTAPSETAVTIVDAEARSVSLERPAARVVSLVPSATLTLDALGARALLVARTVFDTVRWAAGLPTVGGGLQPSLEAIVAVRPDLVVRFGGPQDPGTAARLDDVGIAHVAVRPDRVSDVLEMVDILGTLVGRDAAADSLVRELTAALDAVRRRAAGVEPVRVAYVLGGSPPWVAGPDTYIHELIEMSGGINVFADLGRLYGAVSPEVFLAKSIDVILSPDPGSLDPRIARHARVEAVSEGLELPGPNLADAAVEVARLLRHGGLE